ncbi:hypothetical protein U9K47_08470 [Bacillus toyonensis]|uniref:hypothetical protein n=1 Tax=Bacillus toyonensis TaxID=155322 RepID=UPI00346764AA
MYKKRIEEKEELLRVIDALDELGKDYTIIKATKIKILPPVKYPKSVWIVEELAVYNESEEDK